KLTSAFFSSVFLFYGAASAQSTDSTKTQQQQPPTSGVSTGVAHAAVKDEKSRPITAGGFVDDAPVVFVDVAEQAVLPKLKTTLGSPVNSAIIRTPGSRAT